MAIAGEGNAGQYVRIHATEARRLIEDKMAYHLACIEELKAEWNELAPISTLPPEILSTIFCFASARRTPASPLFPCYYFTHVSRSWRSVALNTPILWHVLPKNIPWATAMLERSKGADLVVQENLLNLSPDSSRVLFLKEVLANHASRIRELHLSWFEPEILEMLFENVPQSSLQLRCLKLEPSYATPPTFPTGIMETENLQTLEVEHCHGPWYSLPLPALTNLKLHLIPNRPPLTKFLEMLRGLATLEVLDMEDSLPFADDPVGPIDLVNLPNLHRLRLVSTNSSREVTNILPLIIVQPTATPSLELMTFDDSSTIEIILDELTLSLSTFLGHLRQGTDFSYSSLHILSFEPGHLELHAWKDHGRMTSTPDLSLFLNLYSTPRASAQDLLHRIFPSLPLFNITSLTLEISPARRLLEDTFGHLSGLKNIKAIGSCTAELIPALKHKAENNNSKPSAILFPALQSLWIKDLEGCSIQELQESLKERRKWNVQLLKLKVTHTCSDRADSEAMDSLRRVVNDVTLVRGGKDDSEIRVDDWYWGISDWEGSKASEAESDSDW